MDLMIGLGSAVIVGVVWLFISEYRSMKLTEKWMQEQYGHPPDTKNLAEVLEKFQRLNDRLKKELGESL